MKATAIKMKPCCYNSNSLLEIDKIYIEDCKTPGWYKKETLHDFLLEYPDSIYVNISPFPYLLPAESIYNEKFVKSVSNKFERDNLLKLPRYY